MTLAYAAESTTVDWKDMKSTMIAPAKTTTGAGLREDEAALAETELTADGLGEGLRAGDGLVGSALDGGDEKGETITLLSDDRRLDGEETGTGPALETEGDGEEAMTAGDEAGETITTADETGAADEDTGDGDETVIGTCDTLDETRDGEDCGEAGGAALGLTDGAAEAEIDGEATGIALDGPGTAETAEDGELVGDGETAPVGLLGAADGLLKARDERELGELNGAALGAGAIETLDEDADRLDDWPGLANGP